MQKRDKDETRTAFEDAYRKRYAPLLSWAVQTVRNTQDAEDILQDVFVSGLTNLETLSLVDNLGAWLFSALRNRVIDRWRGKAAHDRLGETDIADETISEIIAATGFDPQDDLVREELSDALGDAIDALPEEQRFVIVAQAIDGFTFQELSESTGIPVDTLASRKRYAIGKLSVALREWVEDD